MTKNKKSGKNEAVFIDRDGVINKSPKLHDYVKNWDEFEWLPGVQEAIKTLKKLGLLTIVVTNQRGVGRGMMRFEDVEDVHRNIQKDLSKIGTKIDAFYFCPHRNKDNCSCRKPKTGLVKQAEKDFNIEVAKCFVIGDEKKDIEMGQKLGCLTILVLSGGVIDKKEVIKWDIKPDFIARDLKEAANVIGGQVEKR